MLGIRTSSQKKYEDDAFAVERAKKTAPFVVQDPSGCVIPIPSEFDYDMINSIIRHRCGKPGILNFELRIRQNMELITSTSQLLPGASMIVVETLAYEETASSAAHPYSPPATSYFENSSSMYVF